TTRLLSRNRFRLPTLVARVGMLPMEPGSLLMERKMLHGIKSRAERLASATPRALSAQADGGDEPAPCAACAAPLPQASTAEATAIDAAVRTVPPRSSDLRLGFPQAP